MPLDPVLSAGLQPIGIAPPDSSKQMNQLAMLMKMQGLQSANKLSGLQLQSAQQGLEEKQALSNFLRSNPDLSTPEAQQRLMAFSGGPAILKNLAQTRTAETQGKAATEDLFSKKLTNAKQLLQATPDNQLPQFMAGLLHDPDIGQRLTSLMPAEYWAAHAIDAASDPAKAEAWKKGFLLTPAEEYTRAHNTKMEGFRQQEISIQRERLNQAPDEIRAAQAYTTMTPEQQAAYDKMHPQKVGAAGRMQLTSVQNPEDPTQMLNIDANTYEGGGLGSPGVIGLAGKAPAAAKAEEAAQQGQDLLTQTLEHMRSDYAALRQAGGIASVNDSAISNVGNSLAGSTVGQMGGRVVGTETQRLRDNIKSSRSLMLNAIKQATGMTARQMDSNAELKLWLDSVTNPGGIYESNMDILDRIEEFAKARAKNVTPVDGAAGKPERPSLDDIFKKK